MKAVHSHNLKILFSAAAFLFLFISSLFSQRGKEGARTVTAANTFVNEYTALTADAAAGITTLTVTASGLNSNGRFSGSLSAGDLVMIIQMQGALIRGQPDQFTPTIGFPNDATWGGVTNYNNTGRYEFAQVNSVPNGTTITLDCGLQYSYTAAGRVQVVRVPRYTSLTINSGGVLSCPSWAGTTGGVLAVEVDGNTTINVGGKINTTGRGFRGGVLFTTTGRTATSLYSCVSLDVGTNKGEGIGGYDTDYTPYGGKYCRGAPANAGGGGNVWNCGGGGGANAGDTSVWNGQGNPDNSVGGWTTAWNLEAPGFSGNTSSGGGRGGYAFSSNNQDATVLGPATVGNSNAWGGSFRFNLGGLGGRPLDYTTGRIYMGGGGGAGEQDNSRGGAGGAGGGIIYLMSYGTISGNDSIISNGNNGNNSNDGGILNPGRDGAGGGGGGGAIILNSTGTVTGVVASARGGRGGNHVITGSSETEGPGGGGGGGYIAVPSGSTITRNANGGANGTTNSTQLSEFPPNGATAGGSGINNAIIPNFSIQSTGVAICAGQTASLVATLTGTMPNPVPTLYWYSGSAGGSSIGTGSPFVTPVLNSTTTYYVGSCQGWYRIPVTVTVTPTPTVTATPASASICSGTSANLSASGATNYTWTPATGLNTTTGSSVTANPTTSVTYTVVGFTSACSNVTTVVLTVNPAVTINASPSSPAICLGSSVGLTATGATNYTWTPATGLNTTTGSNVTANPTTSTTYTVSGSNGSCSNTSTVTVTVNSSITVNASPASSTICTGGSVGLAATGATNYTWTPATGLNTTTGSSVTANPTSSTTYTITGTSGSCSNTSIAIVNVNSSITVNATAAPATICSGNNTTLTASGATTYTWTPATGLSATTGTTVTANPASSITYTITGTSGSCTNTSIVSVTVNSPITITSLPSASTICSGSSASLSATGATNYTWAPSTGLSASTGSSVTANPTTSITYTITGTTGACSNTAITTVTVDPALSLNVSATPGTICAGGNTTLTATGGTAYSWIPATGLSATTGNSVTASPTISTTYTVVATGGTCSATATVAVTVNSTITVNASPVNSSICAGGSVNLTATGATGYTWTPSTGLSATTGSTVTANPTTSTTYTIIGTAGTCSNSSTAVVSVSSSITMNISPASPAICSGDSVTLTASGASNYTWTPSASLSGTGAPFTASVTAKPTTTTTYTVNGSSGSCTASSTIVVNVGSSIPVVVNASSNSICSGSSVSLTATGAANYSWAPASGLNSTSGGNVTATPSTNTTYTVTGASGSCSNMATVAISVTVVSISVTPNGITVCPGTLSTLTATGANTYTWTPAVGYVNTSGSIVNASPTVSTTYTVIGNNNGCTNSSLVVLNVNSQLPMGVIPSSNSICAGGSVNLTATGANGYTWTPSAGLSSTTGSSVTANPVSSQTYTVIGFSGNCSNSAVAVVNVVSVLPVGASPSMASICPGSTVNLTASGATDFTWIPATGLSSSTGTTVTASPTVSTTYTITGTSGSCSNTSVAVVNIVNSITVNATPATNTICPGSSVVITATGASSYTWVPAAGLNSSTGSTVTANPVTSTTYTVLGASGTCSNTSVVVVNVSSVLPVGASAPSAICFGSSATISASGASTYFWSPSTGLSNTTGASVTATPPASITYTVVGFSGTCSNSSTVSITVNPNPVANAGSNITIVLGTSTTLVASGGNSYSWYPSTGLSCPNCQITQASPSVTTTYYVIVTNSPGCTAIDSVRVTVDIPCGEIFVPNAFSPNQDQNNDVLEVYGKNCIVKLTFIVYDRWGEKVFETEDPNQGWDGTFRGKDMDPGVFAYYLNAILKNNQQVISKGNVSLLR